MEKTQKQLDDISFLRVLATILVVLGHSTYVYTNDWVFKTATASGILNVITRYIYTFHMPLFIFISGYLYYYLRQENNKYNNFKKFVKNKFFRLGVPYIIIAFAYLIPILVALKYYKINLGQVILKDYVFAISPEYLWFIFVLFFIFIIFRLIDRYLNPKVIINILVLLILNLISFKIPQYFLINKIAEYLFYFYVGFLTRKYNKTICNMLKVRFSLLVIFVLQLTVFTITLNVNGKIVNHLSKPVLALIGILLFFGISRKCNNLRTKCLNNKLCRIIDKDSYPIYLLHVPIIYIILNKFAMTNINPYLLVAMCLIVSIVVSIIITEILRKIKLQFVWGERLKTNKQ